MIFDVIIDLRPNSPSYKRYYGVQLSSDGPHMIYIPRGFAHGFQTLTDRVELVYLHSQAYTPSAEEGIRYDDPAFAIKWPMKPINISERDLSHPLYLP